MNPQTIYTNLFAVFRAPRIFSGIPEHKSYYTKEKPPFLGAPLDRN